MAIKISGITNPRPNQAKVNYAAAVEKDLKAQGKALGLGKNFKPFGNVKPVKVMPAEPKNKMRMK